MTMTTKEHSLEIAIIGGGIAGLTLAIGLLGRGIKPVVYERGSSFCEPGAGIGFTSNAEWAMKILDPSIHAAFKRVAVQNETDWFIWVDGSSEQDGTVIHKMYLGERGFEGCHRANLVDELRSLLPEDAVQFSKNLVKIIDEEGEEKVRLEFTDGSSAEADAVIGCDGIRSKVRQLVVGETNQQAWYPNYSHKYAFRGLIPMEKALSALGEQKTKSRHMYLGPGGHALTFPVAEGKLLNVVAFTNDVQDWPYRDQFTAPASKAEAVSAFEQFGPTVRAIIDMLPDNLDKWAVFDTYDHPIPAFNRDRVAISGDSAHAAAPHHGAGAGFAIEDGAVLACVLDTVSTTIGSDSSQKADLIRKAFNAYDLVRLERARWLVETSRYIGEMYEWQDQQVGSSHEKCAREINWRCHKIWHYDIDAMMQETRDVFSKQIALA